MWAEKIIKELDAENILYKRDFLTAQISYLEIGGAARIVVYPKNKKEMITVLDLINRNQIKFAVIGNCSNTFFASNGYNGIVVCTKLFSEICVCKNNIFASCGALISDCSVLAMNSSLGGMEFLCGIPGSVGGAVRMNSAAYGGQISNVVCECEAYDLKREETVILSKNEIRFVDKGSVFSENSHLILLSVKFELNFACMKKIKQNMLEDSLKRINSQPLDMGNCGSTFKRPPNSYASKIIDELHLKGVVVGDAMVSNKHAGFIVNLGNATSDDVLNLINIIKNKAGNLLNVHLEPEIIFVE